MLGFSSDGPDGLVHWSRFSKVSEEHSCPTVAYTAVTACRTDFGISLCQSEGVWVWIDGIVDLIRKHLVDLWREG